MRYAMAAIYFKQNLKFLRKENNKSQADIGLQVNKRSTAISSWENGLSEPSLEDLQIVSDYFGIYIGDLIGMDMADVHLKAKGGQEKNSQNVHLNVNRSVHLKGGKPPLSTGINPYLDTNYTLQKLVETQQSFIESLESQNAIQAKRIADLEEENARLKRDIPQIGKPMEDQRRDTG
jgi:transcriptional regulator with XRE-family HTH domain